MVYLSIQYSCDPDYKANMQKDYRKCQQIAKNCYYFKYEIHRYKKIFELTEEESFYFVVSVVQNIIKEFEMDLEFNYSYKDKYFEFIQKELTINLYIAMVFSRFLYSEDPIYQNTVIQRMYMLKDKYSTFETFIIASSDRHYGYYSIVNIYTLSIKKFRQLESKKNFFKDSVNQNCQFELAFHENFRSGWREYNLVENEYIEKYYLDLIKKEKPLILIKLGRGIPNLNFYYLNYDRALEYSNRRICIEYHRNNFKTSYISYEDIKFVTKEELIKLIPLTKKGQMSKASKYYKLLKTHENFTNNQF